MMTATAKAPMARNGDLGMTQQEFAVRMNGLTREEIAKAMESLPTDAPEWGVGFEAMSHQEPSPSPVMTVREAAEYLDISDGTIRRMVRIGKLTPSWRKHARGQEYIFQRVEVEAFRANPPKPRRTGRPASLRLATIDMSLAVVPLAFVARIQAVLDYRKITQEQVLEEAFELWLKEQE